MNSFLLHKEEKTGKIRKNSPEYILLNFFKKIEISRVEKFHSTVFFLILAHALRFFVEYFFCIKKLGSPDQFLRY